MHPRRSAAIVFCFCCLFWSSLRLCESRSVGWKLKWSVSHLFFITLLFLFPLVVVVDWWWCLYIVLSQRSANNNVQSTIIWQWKLALTSRFKFSSCICFSRFVFFLLLVLVLLLPFVFDCALCINVCMCTCTCKPLKSSVPRNSCTHVPVHFRALDCELLFFVFLMF